MLRNLTIALTLTSALCLTSHAQQPKEPMLPDGRDHSFGKVVKGEVCRKAFRIVNTSNVPMEITSVRRAGCTGFSRATSAWLANADGSHRSEKMLQPGEVGTILIVVDTQWASARCHFGDVFVTTERAGRWQELRLWVMIDVNEPPGN